MNAQEDRVAAFGRTRDSDEDPLCCCEYINKDGERSHIAALCCECDELDEIVDNVLTRKSTSHTQWRRLCNTVEDRMRVPGLDGQGAKKIGFECFAAGISICLLVLLASSHPVMLTMVIVGFPAMLCCTQRFVLRHFPRNQLYMWLTFYGLVAIILELSYHSYGFLSLPEYALFYLLAVLPAIWAVKLKGDPGFVKGDVIDVDLEKIDWKMDAVRKEILVKIDGVDSWKVICSLCRMEKPTNAKHCRICDRCVVARHHHCVWLYQCIGANNVRSFRNFVIALLAFLSYSISVILRMILTKHGSFAELYHDIYYDWRTTNAVFVTVAAMIIAVGLIVLLISHIFCQV